MHTMLWVLAGAVMCAPASSAELTLLVRGAPASRIVLAEVRLRNGQMLPSGVVVRDQAGKPVPAQVIPAVSGSGGAVILVMRVPKAGDSRLTAEFKGKAEAAAPAGPVSVESSSFRMRFDPAVMGGMPSEMVLRSGKAVGPYTWHDRIYDGVTGFSLANDRHATVETVSRGSLCTVVRVRAAYCQLNGTPAAGGAHATYDWYVFRDLPSVLVTAEVQQDTLRSWPELHFLEWNFSGRRFDRFATGNPVNEGALTGADKTVEGDTWAMLTGDGAAVALSGMQVKVYDGLGGYGPYLHGNWETWSSQQRRFRGWLWAGEPSGAMEVRTSAAAQQSGSGRVIVTTAAIEKAIAQRRAGSWVMRLRAAIADSLVARGRLTDAERALRGVLPSGWTARAAGELGLAVEQNSAGARLAALCDIGKGTGMLAAHVPPLVSLTVRQPGSKDDATLTSDSGWGSVYVTPISGGLRIRLASPKDPRFTGTSVELTARAVPAESAWRWTCRAIAGSGTSIRRVRFPQVAMAEPGADGAVFDPRGPGEERAGVWKIPTEYRGSYPGGWCSMQFVAGYSRASRAGLYVAAHDPAGWPKDISVVSDPSTASVSFVFDTPAEDMGRPGNAFKPQTQYVWKLLRGDWYDAAKYYRAWAMRQAKWWPSLGSDGRPDTPLWMRELCAWAQTGGAPAECVGSVKEFQQALGVPVGFHWYNWHVIPFDNDYPHYFPTKEGVPAAVADLEKHDVHVMPYINGRLWDTRDRGTEDFEFTSKAKPAVTKDETGQPVVESYASKESDGSPVRLGVMCPSTEVWASTLRDIVLQLYSEVGVSGVYIDQVAAATPVLCMDPTHGHPLGGGGWWNEGYWRLLGAIRAAKPADRMMTTECNGEPFVNRFDGYLTWHWQYDGMVPAFPAIYGGVVQMFGRNYSGGATKNQAFCAKVGQQLVFGEQIGWMAPGLALEKENIAFLRECVRMRHRFVRYFYAGEMVRPPKVTGAMPRVRSDWQWYGETWVTTDGLLTGAWRIGRERRAVMLFANVSGKPISGAVRLDPAELGAPPSAKLRRSVVLSADDAATVGAASAGKPLPISVPAGRVTAWELRW